MEHCKRITFLSLPIERSRIQINAIYYKSYIFNGNLPTLAAMEEIFRINDDDDHRYWSNLFLTDLQRPRILIDWCTIGSTSASIYWRCNSNRNNVTSFRLCYKLVANDHLNVAFPQLSEAPSSAALVKSGFQFVRLNKFLSKRSSAVLRNLAPQSLYVLALFSANNISESPPSISCFQTSGDQGLGRQGWISHVLPKHRLFTRIYQMVSKVLHRLLYFVLFIYFLLSLFVVVYHSQDLYDAVRHNLFYLFLSDLSTGICSTPPPVDLRSKDQISSEEPWFSWFWVRHFKRVWHFSFEFEVI